MNKFILHCEARDLILAARAAMVIDSTPDRQEATIAFGTSGTFQARRNKDSISVHKEGYLAEDAD